MKVKILIIEITVSTDGLIVKETKLKSNTLENRPKKLSKKTVERDQKMAYGKMELKILETISPNCNIYLNKEIRKKKGKEVIEKTVQECFPEWNYNTSWLIFISILRN